MRLKNLAITGFRLKQLIYFTIPMLLANLLQALYTVVDGIGSL